MRKRGWEVMRRLIFALFLREIRTRFGKYQLGYAWALLEPVSSIAVLLLVFLAPRTRPSRAFPSRCSSWRVSWSIPYSWKSRLAP